MISGAEGGRAALFVELPGQVEPFETPFDRAGEPPVHCQFIYLTNRGQGRYSGLLPLGYDWAALGWGLAQYFPQGYTNLWRLQMVYTAHPGSPGRDGFRQDRRTTPRVYQPKGYDPARTPMDQWKITNLLYVFREPIDEAHPHDVIGKMFAPARAVAMADRYARAYGRRAVVGRMLADMTWH